MGATRQGTRRLQVAVLGLIAALRLSCRGLGPALAGCGPFPCLSRVFPSGDTRAREGRTLLLSSLFKEQWLQHSPPWPVFHFSSTIPQSISADCRFIRYSIVH